MSSWRPALALESGVGASNAATLGDLGLTRAGAIGTVRACCRGASACVTIASMFAANSRSRRANRKSCLSMGPMRCHWSLACSRRRVRSRIRPARLRCSAERNAHPSQLAESCGVRTPKMDRRVRHPRKRCCTRVASLRVCVRARVRACFHVLCVFR